MKAWITRDGLAVLHSRTYLALVSMERGGYAFAVVANGRKATGRANGGTMLDAKRDALATLRDVLASGPKARG